MRLLLALVVVAVVAGGVRADNREDARREFAAGQAADKNKEYEKAIEHYLRAYELVPHHFALYNIATAYERLGQLREASQWFDRYLDEAPQSLVKERRDVEQLIIQLKLRPSKLTVKSTPAGARVLIDGRPAGVTPFTKPIRGGGHRVRVELEGQREERDVFLEYGEPQTVDVALAVVARPAQPDRTTGPALPVHDPSAQTPIQAPSSTATSGVLEVRGSPEGALVAIDEQVVGRVPGRFHVEPGTHAVKVTMYGYQPHDESVTIETARATPIDVALQPGTAPPPSNGAMLGYYLGATGGVDMRGEGGVYMGEFGYRVLTLDVGVRIGKATGRTAIDVVFRWAILKARLAPFIQGGYSWMGEADEDPMMMSSSSSGTTGGYHFGGGLRYDLSRSDSSAISVLAESGVRIHSSSSSDETTLFVPFMASVQFTFGGRVRR